MSDYTNNNRGDRGSRDSRSDANSPSSTHPIRSAGGDRNRYSRNSDAYRVQRNEQTSRRHRRGDSTLTPVEDSSAQSRGGRGSWGSGSRAKGSHSRSRGAEEEARSQRQAPNSADRYSRARQVSEADPADRYNSSEQRSQYKARAKRTRTKRRIVMGVAGVLVAVVAVFAVIGGGFMMRVSANLNQGLDDMGGSLSGTMPGQPFYMLMVGTDESAAREASGNYGGVYRTDSMIVARVDAGAKTVSMISIPRDTMVDLGDEYGVQKINAAHALGGDALTVKAVSQLTGLPISHYAQINFDGFKDVVDALGGIEVKVPIEIDDPQAGGHLDAGKQLLNGKQALILCRSRHSYDGVGSGDLYRAANQRLVLSAIVKKMMKSDVFTMASTVDAVSSYIATDLSAMDLMGLMLGFKGFDTATGMFTAQFPTESQYIDDLWYEVTMDADWASMRSRLDQGLPPVEGSVIDEATGTVMATSGDEAAQQAANASYSGAVSVRNGTDVEGLASSAASVVSGLGFTVNTGNANDTFDTTTIVYQSDSDAAGAKAIKKALGVGTVTKNDGDYLMDTPILVIVGGDYSK